MTREERELRKYLFGPDELMDVELLRSLMLAMRRAVIAQERERCAKYIETNGRGKCVSDDSAKALAAAIRGGG